MAAENYRLLCKKCGKYFEVHITSMAVPGGKDKEEVNCPYCYTEAEARMTDGFVYTYKIEPQPEIL